MKERPIIFNSEMIKAIRDGRKFQTRRILKVPENGRIKPGTQAYDNGVSICFDQSGLADWETLKCPYGKIGDMLWVRETWSPWRGILCPCSGGCNCDQYLYKADPDTDFANKCEYPEDRIRWKPSIFMPRKASRILLEITDIRVERVQDIKEKDCESEGIEVAESIGDYAGALWIARTEKATFNFSNAQSAFQYLWDSINAKRGYGWKVNPFVWVIDFKEIK